MKNMPRVLPIILVLSLLLSLAGFASSAFSTVTASSATDSPQTVPVTLTAEPGVVTVDKQVEASSDDCYTFSNTIRLSRTCLFIDNGSYYMHTYLRFTDVNVPRGATIEHAYIDLCSDAHHGSRSYLRIYGIKEANTNTFSTQVDADGRPVTDAYVKWTMNGLHQNQTWLPGTWYGWTNDPHDIKDVIEEIVGQDGWEADNALAIKIVNTVHESNSRTVYSWNYGDHSLAPKLHIEYSSDLNRAPVLEPIGAKSTDEGNLLQFAVFASEPDGDPLTYSASNLPEGAEFAGQTFSWTPDYHQAGVYEGVHFEVSDGELTDSEDITIVVNNVNLIPTAVIDSIKPNPKAIEGELVSFSGHGEDSDGSIAAYDWSSSVDGSLSNSSSFRTSTLSAGIHTISFKVEDNDGAWSEEVEKLVTILSPLSAIALSPEKFNFAATEGGSNPADQTLGIYNSGDGTLNWSISDDADWLSLNPTSGSSTGETDNIALSVDTAGLSANTYTATITITAPGAANSPQTMPVTLTVKPGGVITVDKQVEASSDDCYTFQTTMRLTRYCLFIVECSNPMNAYMRFTDVDVPQGATIEHAYIDLCSDGYYGVMSDIRIYGIKEANTNTFSTQADADARPVTDAYVEWIMNGLYQNQRWVPNTWYGWTNDPHDIKDVIQEIVDQDGWQADNALTIKTVSIPQGGSARCAYSWNYGDHSLAPRLHIEYSSDLNRAPVLEPIGAKSTDEGKLLQFAISASDPDGDPLTYSASNLPEGANFAGQTFSWTPDYHQAGVYKDVHFEVSDGELTDSEDITIAVNNVNLIPAAVIDSIKPNPKAIEGELVSFSGHGEDSDGSIAAYDWSSSVDGSLSNSSSFRTSTLSAGIHTISFKVEDNDGAWSEEVEKLVTILSPLSAIALSPEKFNFAATEGGSNPADQTLGIYNSGDGTLNWSISDDADWLSLNPTSGSSTGETDNIALSVDTAGLSANTYTATITITAPGAANSPQTMPVTLTVKPGGVITVDKQVEASSDDCYTFQTTMRLTRYCLFIVECSNPMNAYMRFTDVDVPQGATIEHAYIDLCSDGYYGGMSDIRIYGIKEANTNTFSTQADADARPVTETRIDWIFRAFYGNDKWTPGTWYGWTNDPQDIKDVIQEIVGQDGWQADNALTIKTVSIPQGGSARCAYSWDYGDHSSAPKLHIEYSVGADTT